MESLQIYNTMSPVGREYVKPSELLGIFKNFLASQEENKKVVCIGGIYYKSDSSYGQVAYDKIKDENTPEEITMKIPISLRDGLKNGNLVTVCGVLDRRIKNDGAIQFVLNASRVDKVKDVAISPDEVRRIEARRKKSEIGYKNVDNIIESALYKGSRPKVALIYAEGSITNADFSKGLQAAESCMDFYEYRVNFAQCKAMRELVLKLDKGGFDCIALVRGGGSGLEKLDDPEVIEVFSTLSTAWIYGVGHEKENLFIRNIADKVIPIPFALGTYFRDLVENVSQKRNASRAALVEDVKKQYAKQIEDLNKVITQLNESNKTFARKIELTNLSMQKSQAEASKRTLWTAAAFCIAGVLIGLLL